mgnify:CR=1 FL=1
MESFAPGVPRDAARDRRSPERLARTALAFTGLASHLTDDPRAFENSGSIDRNDREGAHRYARLDARRKLP